MLLLDINILVDIITQRSGYYPSLVLLNSIRKNNYKGCISPLTVATTWYLTSTTEYTISSISSGIPHNTIIGQITDTIYLNTYETYRIVFTTYFYTQATGWGNDARADFYDGSWPLSEFQYIPPVYARFIAQTSE